MSGRCVPPAYGSFSTHTSSGAGSCAITAATASGIAPRWTGMCSAWTIMRPARSKSAVEQSRRSLMFEEKAERISTAPISSAIARSELPITCSSTGITSCRSSTSVPDPSVSPTQPSGDPAGRAGQLHELRARATGRGDRAVSRSRGPGSTVAVLHGNQLDLPRAVGVAVALLVRTVEALRKLRRQIGPSSSNDCPR